MPILSKLKVEVKKLNPYPNWSSLYHFAIIRFLLPYPILVSRDKWPRKRLNIEFKQP